jgi:hypothetical protein
MKNYKVACLAVGGLNKKIFEFGDVVSENQFPSGNAEKLVESGHLVRIGESVEVKSEVVKTVEVKSDDIKPIEVKPAYNKISVDEIKAILTAREIDFSNVSKKSDLYALL